MVIKIYLSDFISNKYFSFELQSFTIIHMLIIKYRLNDLLSATLELENKPL